MRHDRKGSIRIRALAAVAMGIVFWSCAAPAPPPPPPLATPLPAPEPRADLWDAPRAVLAEEGYTVTDEDRTKGVLTARLARQTRAAADQREAVAELQRIAHLDDPRLGGAAGRMSEYAITVHVRIGPAEAAEVSMAVKAEISISERARRADAVVDVSHPVPSRGVLEKELIGKIRRRLEE